jgi:hypothetical protein
VGIDTWADRNSERRCFKAVVVFEDTKQLISSGKTSRFSLSQRNADTYTFLFKRFVEKSAYAELMSDSNCGSSLAHEDLNRGPPNAWVSLAPGVGRFVFIL